MHKHHLRIESYGTVDELNSWLGLIRDQDIPEDSVSTLKIIQDRLFTIGSLLAADPEKSRMKIPEIKDADIKLLENGIDTMNESLPELKSFILPGGHACVSYCHIARCVCRRAERKVTHLAEEGKVEPLIIIYLNRLSDYLFILARYAALHFKAPEEPWKPLF